MSAGGPTAAQGNLIETYVSLAQAVPGARIEHHANVTWATADLPHPTCNFATTFKLRADQIDMIAKVAAGRDVFSVYALDDESADALEWGDFRESHRLLQMEAPANSGRSSLNVLEAVTDQMRWNVAQFMMEQFFPRQTAAFRNTLAEATAKVPGIRLFYHPIEGSIVSAALLHETRGITGLYNLCVSEEHRSVGLGGELVRWCRIHVQTPIVLQCRLSLGGWYSSLGFSETGSVRAYSR